MISGVDFWGTDKFESGLLGVYDAFLYIKSSWARVLRTLFFSFFTLCFLIYGSFPGYTIQMFESGLSNGLLAFQSLSWLLYASQGILGVVSTGLYILFAGVTLTLLTSRTSKINSKIEGFPPLIAALAAGCFSCGAGLIGVIGGVGVIATIPITGSEIRYIGIVLALLFISKTGNPTACRL